MYRGFPDSFYICCGSGSGAHSQNKTIMEGKKTGSEAVDVYISAQSDEARPMLKKIRTAIRKAAPEAEELISYGMPAYRQGGILVWFAAAKNHCGLYARPKVLNAFREELKKYETSKSAIRLPLEKPVPTVLVGRIVKQALTGNLRK